MRVRLSFDPTNEQQGIEIHNSRLLITTIGAWVRDTFLVDFEKDFSLLPFSTSALANARAEGRKADEKQMTDLTEPVICVRLVWFFKYFRKRLHALGFEVQCRRYNLLFGHNVYCYSLLQQYYHDFKQRTQRLKSVRLGHSDTYRSVMKGNPNVALISRPFNRFIYFTKRRKLRYRKEYKLWCLHTFLSKIYDCMSRERYLYELDGYARNNNKRRVLRRLFSLVRGKKVNLAFSRRDNKLYNRELCRHYFYMLIDITEASIRKRERENRKIKRFNSDTLLTLKKMHGLKTLHSRSNALSCARGHEEDAVRYDHFYMRSIGMDALYKHAIRCTLFRGAARAGSKMFYHVALRKAFDKMREKYKLFRKDYVNTTRGSIHMERKKTYDFFKRIVIMMKVTNVDTICLYKSVLLWKTRRLRRAMKMFKLNTDIRIKRRTMLRNSHVEYHDNMQNLLCTQWLKVYSQQVKSKSRHRGDGPLGKTDLGSLARNWLDRRHARKTTRYPKSVSGAISESAKTIIEAPSASIESTKAFTTLGTPSSNVIPFMIPATDKSTLAYAKPRNNLEEIVRDISTALRPRNMMNMNVNAGL